jgi:putative endonuclease
MIDKATVYIIRSLKTSRLYVGFTTKVVEDRVLEHNDIKFEDAFTKRDRPWVLYFQIICESEKQARGIEAHIKKMKSKKYIENLLIYPEIVEQLLVKFNTE